MIRPGLHEDVVERLNEACEPHMAVDPEDVSIEKRIGVLVDAHEELEEEASKLQAEARLSGVGDERRPSG